MKKNQYLSYYIRLFLVQFLPNEKGFSENTILAYRDAIKLLLRFCADHLKIKIDQLPCDKIDDEIVRKFLDYLEQEKGCSPNTRNARLAALKTFFYYLGREVPGCLDNSQRISAIPQKKIPINWLIIWIPMSLRRLLTVSTSQVVTASVIRP